MILSQQGRSERKFFMSDTYTYRYGFFGAGNMGSAMIGGLLSAGLAEKEQVIASVKSEESRDRISGTFGIHTVCDTAQACNAKILILAVKPYQFDQVLPTVQKLLNPDQILISVAAGKTLSEIENAVMNVRVAGFLKAARVMPNTPALVGESMSAVSFNSNFSDEDKKKVMELFSSFGRAEEVPESMMDAVTGVSGSSPAFVYMMIEAMADAAVAEGMPRAQAYTFAAQSVLGSAEMVLKTKKAPGELKDAVCSPGGTTIEGVCALESLGFRSAVIEGVRAAVEKSRELSGGASTDHAKS